MKFAGKMGEDWGMRNVSAGWHEGVIEKVEEITSENTGNKSLRVQVKITSGDDEGLNISIFAPWDKEFGERKIGSIVAEVGLIDAFEKAFPGDVSFFDKRVVAKLYEKLPGYPCKVYVSEDKSGKYPPSVTKFRNIKSDEDKVAPKPQQAKAAKSKSPEPDDAW